ncbi:MFS general substrate transporter [Polychaeton citri CBS 116435]|uniref:MFS general substrate transporter n=1 Tax=Polychaeton citri CBS 116435 TaxID=1314669 RepID=A0A9P4US31_9PEZI|nr:MFS general substrate transporter [Polychaeton citri CBS 116435]
MGNIDAASLVEKKDDSRRTSASQHSPSPRRIENGIPNALLLNEDDALIKARAQPNDTQPIWITFSGHDPSNPRNWPKWQKWYITCFCSMLNIVTCICAGGFSSAAEEIATDLGVSAEAATVGLSMYILGFAVGPMVLAPLSEYFGRSITYQASWFFLVIFQIAIAMAPNIGTIVVCRFIQGFGGSAPLTNTGGTISDLWERNESGNAMMIYGVSSTFGPPIALVISGYIVQEQGWRMLFWVMMAITGAFWIATLFTLPETRHSIILERKAKKIRKMLAKEGLTAERISDEHSKGEKRSLHSLFAINLTRPFRFLFTEPITMGAAAYNGFIYGIVYLFNEAFPKVFGPGGHNFNTGEWGLAFLGLAVGVIIAAAFYPLQERYYLRRVAENHGKGVPEARMWQARFGAVLLPVSLFWFAWTSYPSVHWIVPIIASAFFGAGIYIVILGVLNYVVDSYQSYSASALAGVILVRNLVGAGFPLFASQMYDTLGNEWASCLLAFLAILFVPIPVWWFYKGETLRLKSPFAREHFNQDEDKPH